MSGFLLDWYEFRKKERKKKKARRVLNCTRRRGYEVRWGGVDIKADTQVLGILTIPPAVFDSFFFLLEYLFPLLWIGHSWILLAVKYYRQKYEGTLSKNAFGSHPMPSPPIPFCSTSMSYWFLLNDGPPSSCGGPYLASCVIFGH